MARCKRPPELISGLYGGIPHAVMDSLAFIGASDRAKSLLFALIRQTNGSNNGHLHLTDQWLAKQGWPSVSLNQKARDELIERGLIAQTTWGGLNLGANQFAVTWLAISNFVGLDISSNDYPRGAWALCKLAPTPRRKPPQKRDKHSDYRSSSAPTTGAAVENATPSTGAKIVPFSNSTTPTTGNNVLNHYPPAKSQAGKKRIVGKIGRSGTSKLKY